MSPIDTAPLQPDPAPSEESDGAPPVLEVHDAALVHAFRQVFSGVTFATPARTVVAVEGAAGSGKTSLLLALAGRMRLTAGTVQVGHVRLEAPRAHGRALRAYRKEVSIARVADLVGLDPELTLSHNTSDAADWVGVRRERAFAHLAEWGQRLGFDFDLHARVSELPALEAAAAHLVLGILARPQVVIFDDASTSLQVPERRQIWQVVRAVADSGPVVVASTLDLLTLDADIVVRLGRGSGHAPVAALVERGSTAVAAAARDAGVLPVDRVSVTAHGQHVRGAHRGRHEVARRGGEAVPPVVDPEPTAAAAPSEPPAAAPSEPPAAAPSDPPAAAPSSDPPAAASHGRHTAPRTDADTPAPTTTTSHRAIEPAAESDTSEDEH